MFPTLFIWSSSQTSVRIASTFFGDSLADGDTANEIHQEYSFSDGTCNFDRYYKREVPDGFKGKLHMIEDLVFQKENPINNRVNTLLARKAFTLEQLFERYSGVKSGRGSESVWTMEVAYYTEGGMTVLINHFYDLIRCFTKKIINQDCFGLFVFEDHGRHSWTEKPAELVNPGQPATFRCSKCLYLQTVGTSNAETMRVYSRYLKHPACAPVGNETFFTKFLEIDDIQLMLFPKLRNHEINKIMRVSKRVLHICGHSAYWSHYAKRIFPTWDQIPKLFEIIKERHYYNFKPPFSNFRFPLDMMKLPDNVEIIAIEYFCPDENGATITKKILFDTGSTAAEILELLGLKEGEFRGLVNFKGIAYDRQMPFDHFTQEVQRGLLGNLHHACLLPWRTYRPETGTAWYLVSDPAQFGLCAYCRKYFREDENTDRSCRYHPGKHGSRVTGYDTWGAHTYSFWDCCDSYYQDQGFDGVSIETGCRSRKHRDIFKAGCYPVVDR